MTQSKGPMAGLRIVDFTHILAGPFCTQLLADAGAVIVKVESPGGEFARIRGPQRHGSNGDRLSSYYAAVNRGKRSIVIDLKTEAGLTTARRLARTADVVIENFSPGALLRLGVDLAELREADPRMVTCSISLYGGTETAGPMAARGGLAIVAEAESSVTGMTRDKDDVPVPLGTPFGDMSSGLAAYAAIATALYEREKTGRGQHLDITMIGSLWALNAMAVTGAQIAQVPRSDMHTAWYGIFACADGYVALGVNNDSLFRRAAAAIGRAELADDPRYTSYADRDAREDELNALLGEWMITRSSRAVIEAIGPSGVPIGKVTTPGEMLEDPVFRAMGFVETVQDSLGGVIDVPVNPLGFRHGRQAIPSLGAGTQEILTEIGIDQAGIELLREQGAFGLARH